MQRPHSSIRPLQILVVVAVSGQLGMARATDIQVNGELQVLAQRLQTSLPRLATDKLIEARRTKQGWEYRILVAEAKTSTDVLEVQLNATEKYTQNVRIRLLRKEGKFFGGSGVQEQAVPARWTQEVAKILNE
jgi:D-alanyl-D-alanine carboxypeptidase